MTQPRRILWLAVFGATFSLLGVPAALRAQTYVTPNVAPTPPGKLIVVNNGPGDQTDPHVGADLVSYSNTDGTNFTIRYFDLLSLTDKGIPNSASFDFLADVRGSTIAFTRVTPTTSAIYTFDTSAVNAQPVEIAPQAASSRQAAQIGDRTIVWQDSPAGTSSDIVAFDRQSGTTTRLTNDSELNQSPGISPDGKVIVWEKCANVSSPCQTWKATFSNGTWTAQQLVSQVGGNQSHPDTDGTIIAYSANFGSGDQLVWQPVSGGTEQVLSLAGGVGSVPSVSGGLIAFAGLKAGASAHDIYVFDTATSNLYQITNTPADEHLNDISVTPDGKVRVVWDELDSDFNIYAYTFNLPVGDFNLGAIAPLTISAGGSGSTNANVNPLNGFSSSVSLSVTGQPAGVMASLSPNSVTPSGGSAATSVLSVSLPSFLVPSNFSLTVTGASGSLSHSATADVSVTSTTNSITNLIGDLQAAGCVDNIANALTSKLAAAQAAIGAGNIQTAINTLTALKNQINAQAGKHIATSCTIGGAAFNPVTVLLLDVQGLIDSLRVSLTPDPIIGYVVDRNGVGVAGATVSIVDGNGSTVAMAVTDITGFYFIATTGGVLTPGATYTLQLGGLPAGFLAATPASQPFTWRGSALALSNFVLN